MRLGWGKPHEKHSVYRLCFPWFFLQIQFNPVIEAPPLSGELDLIRQYAVVVFVVRS